MLWLFRFIRGFLNVRFSGENPEKILNICAKNGFALWDTYLINNGIETNISLQSFLKIRPFLRGSHIRIHIISKRGIPFKIAKYKLRSGLVCGVVLFFVLLRILSSFVWIIEFEGNEKISAESLKKICAEIGVKEGIYKSEINSRVLTQKLLLLSDEIAWGSFNVEGSKLTVNISEIEVKKPQEIPSNLIANKDAIIKKIDVTKGEVLVSVGDVVKKGQVLVSGVTQSGGATEFLASKGKIEGEFREEITLKEPFKKTEFYETGESTKIRAISIFTLKIPLFLRKENRSANVSFEQKNLTLFGQKLPIELFIKTYNITEKYEFSRQYDDLVKILEERFSKKFENKDYTIISKEFVQDSDALYLKATLEMKENIATESLILVQN